MRSLKLSIQAVAVPKGRHRTLKSGRTYTPPATQAAAWRLQEAIPKGFVPLQGPLGLRIKCYHPRPKAKKLQDAVWPATKPDLPNIIMLVADALSAFGYGDDSQIALILETEKLYCDGIPTWEVEVWELT